MMKQLGLPTITVVSIAILSCFNGNTERPSPDAPGAAAANVDACQDLLVESRLCNWPSVRKLLEAKTIDVNCPNSSKETALMLAAHSSCVEAVDLLLGAGADVNVKAAQGESALFYAAISGNAPIVNRFLEQGVEPDIKTKDYWTPLMAATAGGHVDTVRSLVENGAFIRSVTPKGHSPLLLASVCEGRDFDLPWEDPHIFEPIRVSEVEPWEVSFVGIRPRGGCYTEIVELLETAKNTLDEAYE